MPFFIYCVDDPAKGAPDDALRAEHRQYLYEVHKDRIIVGGPLLTEDGQGNTGRFIVTDHATRAEAETFLKSEPYFRAGRVTSHEVKPTRMAFPPK